MSQFEELHNLMENEYNKRGASNNAAQLTLRYNVLKTILNNNGYKKTKDLLINNFNLFHKQAKEIVTKKLYL